MLKFVKELLFTSEKVRCEHDKKTRNAEILLSSRKYIHSFMQDIDQSEAEDSFQLASDWTNLYERM